VTLAPLVTPVTLAAHRLVPGATLLHSFLSLTVVQSQSVAVVSGSERSSSTNVAKVSGRDPTCWGKVEFCLPTKLHAPSLADCLIRRKGCALNALGLFAPEAQATLEAKRSDLAVHDPRFGEPEQHRHPAQRPRPIQSADAVTVEGGINDSCIPSAELEDKRAVS
jgi:hypothetical protein